MNYNLKRINYYYFKKDNVMVLNTLLIVAFYLKY